MNKKGTISIKTLSNFYVNYDSQGTHMSHSDTLVAVYFKKYEDGSVDMSENLVYSLPNTNLARDFLGVTFSVSSFEEAAAAAVDAVKNSGFVKMSKISYVENEFIEISGNFPSSTNAYYISYEISGNGQRIDGQIYSDTYDGDVFFVDDHNILSDIYPSINTIIAPSLKVNPNTITYLYGIPSVHTIDISYGYEVSNFAGEIIPYNNWNGNIAHLKVPEISKSDVYSFAEYYKSNVYNKNAYTFDHNDRSDTSTSILYPGYYQLTDSSFKFEMYYLLNDVAPCEVKSFVSPVIDLSLNGTIFQDSSTNYTGVPIHIFNGHDDVSSTPIVVTSPTFATDYSSDISHMLFYFDGKFVSGGYYHTSNGVDIYPFDDWSDGFATNAQGQDYSIYSDTSYNGYKWIALDVTSKRNESDLDLSELKINDEIYYSTNIQPDTFRAYLCQSDGIGGFKFGNINKPFHFKQWWSWPDNGTIDGADLEESVGAAKGSICHVDPTSNAIYLVVGLKNNSYYFTFS